MGPCYTCKRTVAFGGIKANGLRFCSKSCHAQKAELIDALGLVSDSDVDEEITRIKNGKCTRCGQQGRIEFHKSAFVWSAIIITRISEKNFVGCSGCALQSQALSSAGTLLAGWWGIPFGLILTPSALVANVYQMVVSATRKNTSNSLRDYARERLALAHKFGGPTNGTQRSYGRVEPRF